MIFIALAFCALYTTAVFTGLVTGVKHSLGNDPAESAYTGKDMRETQAQKSQDIKDKQELMMERTRAQMERMKR